MKPLLVGESNPYQPVDASEERLRRYALYPRPRTASGYRLMQIIGVDERTYLSAFDRIDLCHPKWSLPKAREVAARLVAEREEGDAIVLLGSKVSQAFGQPFLSYAMRHARNGVRLVMIPHPSPLCRLWHVPGAVDRAREVLRVTGVLPVSRKTT